MFTAEQWYDRSTRSWITELKDGNGYTICDAMYDGTRADAASALATMREYAARLNDGSAVEEPYLHLFVTAPIEALS